MEKLPDAGTLAMTNGFEEYEGDREFISIFGLGTIPARMWNECATAPERYLDLVDIPILDNAKRRYSMEERRIMLLQREAKRYYTENN